MASTVSTSPVTELNKLVELSKQLPETDGEPLETPWHHAAISLLIDILTFFWRERKDFFVGGNMFLYYSLPSSSQKEFKGPDFFFVDGVERHRPRESWIVWNEGGRYPDVIVEFISRSTAQADRTTKKDLYEKTFHTSEYFCFDPDTNRLEGWRLINGRYHAILPDARGWMWSERLGLWLGTWEGEYLGQRATWLRFFDPSGNLVLLRSETAEMEVKRLQALVAEKENPPTLS